jgi:hypothetical protein
MTKELQEAVNDACNALESTGWGDFAFALSKAALDDAKQQYQGTTPLPDSDYGTRPVTPHPLDTIADS